MIKRWKALDPMTRSFIKVAAVQTAILTTIVIVDAKLTTIEIVIKPRD